MKIKVKITKDLLMQEECAITTAIRELISNAIVGITHIDVGDFAWRLPTKVQDFIDYYDMCLLEDKQRITPFDFELMIDTIELFEVVEQSKVYKVLSESKHLEFVEF